MSKYYNKKIIVDGVEFDSKNEANRYVELKLLEHTGHIKDLELQVPFLLQPSFKKNGKTIRAIRYIADFVYFDNDLKQTVVEDVKGYRTEVYKLKKKLFEYNYPDLVIVEVF